MLGRGWLIFALPPSELAVHPADTPSHQLALMCDNLDATMTELREKGITFRGKSEQMGWGVAVTMVLAGEVEVMLYQPRHASAMSR